MMIGIGITLVGGGRVGPPAGTKFVQFKSPSDSTYRNIMFKAPGGQDRAIAFGVGNG